MTEIPEHLLKRSREKRQALGQGGDAGDAPAAAAATPAKAAPATPAVAPKAAAPAAPPPKQPDPPYIVAATSRRKMPFWAMGALSFLPLWGFMYARGLTPEEKVVAGPIGIGAETYGACSSCHGVDGAGGAGRQLNNGEVLKTFPRIEDMLNLVYTGSQAYEIAGLTYFGDPEREGGAHVPGWGKGSYMPAQGASLSAVEILGVVCHERYTLGGADPAGDYAEEYAEWCAEDAPKFIELEEGVTFDELEGVGTEPRESVLVAGGEETAGG